MSTPEATKSKSKRNDKPRRYIGKKYENKIINV